MGCKTLYYWCLSVFFLSGCQPEVTTNSVTQHHSAQKKSVNYAKGFGIKPGKEYTEVYVLGNKHNTDTTARFVLYTERPPKHYPAGACVIKTPCTRMAALSSIYARMFYELGALQNLVAIDNMDYISCEAIHAKFKAGQLKEIAKGIDLDIEQTITAKPDIVFGFGMGNYEKDRNKKLEAAGIPFAVSIDHLEANPLARAEWIKFFAAFINKSHEADKLFNDVVKHYNHLRDLAAQSRNRPRVFNEIKYSDAWYMPGGKSYVAQLLEDAGADYVWKDNSESGSLALSFEQVYAKAKHADFWINLSTVKSKAELLAYEPRYAEFKAFKTGQLYNNNLHVNTHAYSDYWETGMIYPNRILSDLIHIFHPEIQDSAFTSANYYQKIN